MLPKSGKVEDPEKGEGEGEGESNPKTPAPINETERAISGPNSSPGANEGEKAAKTEEKDAEGEGDHEHHDHHDHKVSKRTAVVLVLALGFHALFEGVAFGLMTEITKAGQLALGVVIHKGAEAISLGGALTKTGFSLCEVAALIFLFSILTPIGGIAGLIFADTSIIVDTVFMAIAGGTFIYVSCSEMVVQEFDKGGYTWLKMLLVVLGGATITCLHFLPHTHSHNPEQGGHTHGPGSDHDHL